MDITINKIQNLSTLFSMRYTNERVNFFHSMQAREIREKYVKFFESKGHRIIPSAPLLPENDPTVLFTTAGMHPLVPSLLGEPHPAGVRLPTVQKCVRTGDIDEVGAA